MTTLITGATGFVGSAVARRFLAEGQELRLLVREDSARDHVFGLDAELVTGDLLQPATLLRAVEGCEALVHVAADNRLWVTDVDATYQTNVTGTLDLMRVAVASGVQRIVYTSSAATLGGRSDRRLGDETAASDLDAMIGHYCRSKYLAEASVLARVRDDGWPVVIVNPCTPIGPRDGKPTPTGQLLLAAARGRLPAFVDTGFNAVHVDDVANGHWLALRDGKVGERYILGGENLRLRDVLTQIARLTGGAPPSLALPNWPLLPAAAVAELAARLMGGMPLLTVDGVRLAAKWAHFSSAKAERDLGYASRPACDALHDAIEWYRDHGYLIG